MIEKSTSRASPAKSGRRVLSRVGKRLLDLVVAGLALILLAPFLALIALAVKHDSPGPVIYRGARAGRGGKPFQILKFRTMYERPESYTGPKVTGCDDPRVTPLGCWLRDTKLNELPQFWNVLRGEMSLVGPRPEDPDIALGWPEAVRDEILSVRPGITSPASVLYHNEEALLRGDDVFRQYIHEVAPDKIRLDQLYVQRRSFLLDLDSLVWTVLIMIPRIGAHDPPEEFLFVGPITRLVRQYINWFVADFLVVLGSVLCTGLLWRALGPLHTGWLAAIAAALAVALLFSAIGAIFGIYRIDWSQAARGDLYRLARAWASATTIILAANLLGHIWPFWPVASSAALALAGLVAIRYRSRMATGLASHLIRRRARAYGARARALADRPMSPPRPDSAGDPASRN